MNVAEWILVAILAVTLFIFLVVGIVLMVKIIGMTGEAKRVIIKSQDIADNANGVMSNVRGMTSIGGVVQTFVDKYVEPKLKEAKSNEKKGSKNEETDEKVFHRSERYCWCRHDAGRLLQRREAR